MVSQRPRGCGQLIRLGSSGTAGEHSAAKSRAKPNPRTFAIAARPARQRAEPTGPGHDPAGGGRNAIERKSRYGLAVVTIEALTESDILALLKSGDEPAAVAQQAAAALKQLSL